MKTANCYKQKWRENNDDLQSVLDWQETLLVKGKEA